jgi:hypothetical protein
MKIRKILIIMLAMMMITALGACGGGSGSGGTDGSGSGGDVPVDQIKTLGDAFAIDADDKMYAFDSEHFVMAFEKDGKAYRVFADMTQELYDESDKIEYDDEREEKINELLGSVKITKVEDITEYKLSQEDMDKLVGMTGQQLLDDGFTTNGYYIDGDSAAFFVEKGFFSYMIHMNEVIDAVDEDADAEELIKPLTVKSVEYTGLAFGATDADVTA